VGKGYGRSLFYLSVLSFGEIRRGIERLPQGARRARLRRWLEIDLTDRFEDRILGIDRHVAEIWGMIMARGAAASVRPPTVDTLIAATAERQPAIFAISLMRQ
jgi:toxin FitB